MIRTCMCFDAILTAEGFKTFEFQSEGETVTSHTIYPSRRVRVHSCYKEDPLDDKGRFITSVYTVIVVHVYINVHVNVDYDAASNVDNGHHPGEIEVHSSANLNIRGNIVSEC